MHKPRCAVSARPRVSRLGILTIVACVAATAAAFLLPPPSVVVAAIDLVCFAAMATLGLRALGDISDASRPAREIAAATRTASLRPRRLKDYVPVLWRLLPLTITSAGLALLAWRLELARTGPPSARSRDARAGRAGIPVALRSLDARRSFRRNRGGRGVTRDEPDPEGAPHLCGGAHPRRVP